VAHLPLTQEALPALVERLQDVEPQVSSSHGAEHGGRCLGVNLGSLRSCEGGYH
jgi:hypothetical protein